MSFGKLKLFKHKIFGIYRSFSYEDIRRFEDFLLSPYHNKSQKVIKLFKTIIQYYPLFTDSSLTKENICRNINPSGKYNDSTLRSILSRLFYLTEEFFISENFNKNKIDRYNFLIKELINRNLTDICEKQLKGMETELDSYGGLDSMYFYYKHLYETNKFNLNITNKKITNSKEVHNDLDHITLAGIYFINHFVTEIISEYMNLSTFAQKFNLDLSFNPLNSFIKYLDVNRICNIINIPEKHSILLQLYDGLFKTFANIGDDRFFFKYKRLITEHRSKLTPDEISFHYYNLINYCIIKKIHRQVNITIQRNSFLYMNWFLKMNTIRTAKLIIYHMPFIEIFF